MRPVLPVPAFRADLWDCAHLSPLAGAGRQRAASTRLLRGVARLRPKAHAAPSGTYNFAGDLGKATLPPAVSLLLTVMVWRSALYVVAVLGVLVAALILWLMPLIPGPPASVET